LVDRDRISELIRLLDELTESLHSVVRAGEHAYLQDARTRRAAERELQLALQICIDVGAHLVAELGLGHPGTYGDVFRSLAEADVLDPELAARLVAAAGLRNLLVHGYADLDDRQVWAALNRLDDVRAFAAAAMAAVTR
jgi:uncharacterized protein YutE (UPF0331/DUF86 family)